VPQSTAKSQAALLDASCKGHRVYRIFPVSVMQLVSEKGLAGGIPQSEVHQDAHNHQHYKSDTLPCPSGFAMSTEHRSHIPVSEDDIDIDTQRTS
jgi:hypothetical protein